MTTPDIAGLSNRDPATFPTNDPTNPLHRLADDLQRGRLKVEGVKEDVTYALSTLERQAAEIKRLRAGLTASAVKLQLARGWLVEAGACRERVTATSRACNEARAALTGEDT